MDMVENHISADVAWSQTIEIRVSKLETHQIQILEGIAEIKESLKALRDHK